MQYVKAGQNVNHEMFNQFPEQLILKSSSDTKAAPVSVICTGKFTGFICSDHSCEGSSFLITLLNYHSRTALRFKLKTNAASIHDFLYIQFPKLSIPLQ